MTIFEWAKNEIAKIEVNCGNLEDVVNDLESLYYVKKGGNK